MSRVFLLSPASCHGERAKLLLRPEARLDLALRLRGTGAPLGEAFAFLSGLYFRGKLAYARAFANPPPPLPGVFVITPCRGLLEPQRLVTLEELGSFAAVPIDVGEPRYLEPLLRDLEQLAQAAGPATEFVLLGSVASAKYAGPLSTVLEDRLRFPPDFVGRGDMSRGGLLLRCLDAGRQLEYAPLGATTHHGARPPRLEPRRPGPGTGKP